MSTELAIQSCNSGQVYCKKFFNFDDAIAILISYYMFNLLRTSTKHVTTELMFIVLHVHQKFTTLLTTCSFIPYSDSFNLLTNSPAHDGVKEFEETKVHIYIN